MKRAALLLLFLLPATARAADIPNDDNNKDHPVSLTVPHPAPSPPAHLLNGQFRAHPHAPAPAAGPPGPPTLHWKNGESLAGNIAAASAGTISWKSPFFDDPLEIAWPVLDRVELPSAPVSTTEPFSIELRDGSFLYGDLASLTADSVSIHSTRHGDTMLKRSEVLSVRRLRRGNLLFSGPTGDVGWESIWSQPGGDMVRNQPMPWGDPALSLATGPGGALTIGSWNRSALMELPLPDLVEVEFRVSSSKRPEFSLSLGANLRQALRIETWDDELVLTVGDEFKAIRKIEDPEREVALHVCWDGKARKCSVYTPAGEWITSWQATANLSGSNPDIVLQNKGPDLSLDFLRIRTWDGKPPARIDAKLAHVELTDGRSLPGEITAGAPGFIQVQAPGQSAATPIALGDVDALVFSSDPPQIASPEMTFLYADGAMVFGRITSMAGGRAAITTSFTKEPLMARMDQLRRLRIKTPAPADAAPPTPLADQDKIEIEEATLHGRLSSAGADSPGWTPVGGAHPSRPSQALTWVITRAIPANAVLPNAPALAYLSSGDVLAGKIGSLDRSGAEFQSNLMDVKKLPSSELDAIQFDVSPRINVRGFADPGWHIVKGDESSVQRGNNTLVMNPGTAIAYPSLMQCSEINFKYASTNGLSACRLRLFCAGTDGKHSMNLLLGNAGNQFITGMESESMQGQFDNQAQTMVKPGEPVSIRLTIEDKRLNLYVNGISAQQIPIESSKRAGTGFILEPTGLWGNNPSPVSLSDFSTNSIPGSTWLPEVAGDIKTQALTVPRFQKNDPPRHLLLAANGDVLRGEIEAATDSHFGFRCGLENLDVPRDRVKAVIWLQPPDPNAPATPAAPPPPSPLDHMLPMRIMFQAGLAQITSFLHGQDNDLNFKLPDRQDQRIVPIQLGNQTVADALEVVCSRFDLRYRVGDDGTVIFESADPPPIQDGLVRKTYWLKPDAIPASASAQDILTARGIAFPQGASAQWQPTGHLLSMTNTPDSQAKLAALIDSDFGGSLGSPTHWLQLTDGARLTLAVDKFEPDSIIGHHPLYGICKVPMSQVYAIRTSPPDPTSTIKTLENWRLVNAPEPVPPGPGGESSPLLGKDAATFQLSLLDGENFDLGAEKGHVVVLDFWASWCGPCVESLPGLIEAMSSFPREQVKLIGVNQGESSAQVKHFLETRGLKFTVAMDADQSVAQKYGVDAIPHTVIVGPDGKVAWAQTGYDPDGDTEAADVVRQLLKIPSPIHHL